MKTDANNETSPSTTHFWEQAKTQARYALNWGRKVTKVGKLKMELARLHRERVALFEGLGRKTYELQKENTLDGAALAEFVSKIDQVSERIKNHEKLLGKVADASVREDEPEKPAED